MGNVIPIHSRRTFTHEDALQILPIVKRITESSAFAVRELQEQLQWVPQEEPLYKRIKGKVELAVRRWAVKISHLGCEPRGVWFVDFDAGDGWYSWRLGDSALTFFNSSEGSAAKSSSFDLEELTT